MVELPNESGVRWVRKEGNWMVFLPACGDGYCGFCSGAFVTGRVPFSLPRGGWEIDTFPVSEPEFDRWMRLAIDCERSINYCKEDGQWYWSHNDEYNDPRQWHGPFYSYFRALHNAVEPFLDKGVESGEVNPGSEVRSG